MGHDEHDRRGPRHADADSHHGGERGDRNLHTDAVTVSGRVKVCWEVAGDVPAGSLDARASFQLVPRERTPGTTGANFLGKAGTGCDIEVIEDAGYSAKDLKRPGVKIALEILREGGADALVVAKLDRLSRSMLDFLGSVLTWKIVFSACCSSRNAPLAATISVIVPMMTARVPVRVR